MEMSIWVPIISAIGGAIVGWFLGFCDTLIVERRRRKQLGKDFKEGLFAELKEALPRFVASYYLLNEKLGKTDRDVLNWVHSMGAGNNEKLSEWSKRIESLLKLSDNQLAAGLTD